jgi:hypothetical protein
LPNHRPLKFSERASYLENELAHGGRRQSLDRAQLRVDAERQRRALRRVQRIGEDAKPFRKAGDAVEQSAGQSSSPAATSVMPPISR